MFIVISKSMDSGTAAYNYMNRLVKIFRIDVSSMKDTTPSQKEKLKQIRKYDYVSRKSVFRFLWLGEELNKHHLAYLYENYPKLRMLQTCVMEWRQIFRTGYQSLLYSFLDKYHTSEIKQIAGFVGGLMKDMEAVENAVSSPLSNVFVEGTNSKLKMIKRIMYGRCSRQLLAAKLMLFKDKTLSAKAKGILVEMLSLPENWDYTLKGLTYLFSDGIDSIRQGIRELEEHGYIVRERKRDAKGALCVWGGINLLEGYGSDNPGAKSQGVKQLVAK